MTPSENSLELKSQIYSLVESLPNKYTEIVAELIKTEKFVCFYLESSGVDVDNIDYKIELGIMRYLIAHGNTTVQAYENKNGSKAENLDQLERDKYNVYK